MISHKTQAQTNPSRVVVIGARGFIGTAVQRQLISDSIPMLALGSNDLDLTSAIAPDKLASLLRPDDSVVMLAALTPDKGRDIATLMQNLTMMQTVCSAIEKSSCAHFVYFSSDAVYDPGESKVSEQTAASPPDLYGAMHYTREIMAGSLTDVPVLILRPTGVYGQGDTHNSYGPNRFRQTALNDGKITLFGGGEETRDHIYVDDVAALTVRCLLHKSIGTLNVATGVSTSFIEIARIVANVITGVDIITTPRVNPVTHRHYDRTNLIKVFPDYHFISPEDGIARVHDESGATR